MCRSGIWRNAVSTMSRRVVRRRGVFACVGWQVALCDPIWQVTLRSCEMDMGFHYTGLYFLLLGFYHGVKYLTPCSTENASVKSLSQILFTVAHLYLTLPLKHICMIWENNDLLKFYGSRLPALFAAYASAFTR